MPFSVSGTSFVLNKIIQTLMDISEDIAENSKAFFESIHEESKIIAIYGSKAKFNDVIQSDILEVSGL